MTRLRFLLAVVPPVLWAPAPAVAQQPAAEAEVLATVHALLDVLRTRDLASVAHLVDSTTRFTLLRPTPDGGSRVVVLSGERFLQAVTRPGPPVVELTRNPEVRIDGDLAAVWVEYQLLVDGVVDHCGYDAFHLARLAGVWKILNVSDSFRRDCGPPWRSP